MLRSMLLVLAVAALLSAARGSGPFLEVRSSGAAELFSLLEADTLGKENRRVVGSLLAVFLGPFGAHRIYLGTKPHVAVFYGLTFGGFGVLPLIDLGHLIFTKDLDRFRNAPGIFMWRTPTRQ